MEKGGQRWTRVGKGEQGWARESEDLRRRRRMDKDENGWSKAPKGGKRWQNVWKVFVISKDEHVWYSDRSLRDNSASE